MEAAVIVATAERATPDLATWADGARRWLGERFPTKPRQEAVWGAGSDSVAIFDQRSDEEQRARLAAALAWHREKLESGFALLTWAQELGGRGLSADFDTAYRAVESEFATPEDHELLSITLELIGPTLLAHGDPEQHTAFLPALLAGADLWCQLFSEPTAGSDLAAARTAARRTDQGWVLDGQKVWTSGAQLASQGLVLARNDPSQARRGLTMFAVAMASPGVEVRPLRQMTGGAQFNEVFLSDVEVPDGCVIGEVGGGWEVARTTLAFERLAARRGYVDTDLFARLVDLARHRGAAGDRATRQQLARCYSDTLIQGLLAERAMSAVRAGRMPGPEGSIGKLFVTESLRRLSAAADTLLGPSLVADDGAWGTYAWAELTCGLPGIRIAGGSDEIQRNIIAERVLALPREPAIG